MWNLILFIGNIKMTIVMFSPVTLLIVAAVFLSLRTNRQLAGYNSFGVRESDKFDQKYNEVKRMALICSVVYPVAMLIFWLIWTMILWESVKSTNAEEFETFMDIQDFGRTMDNFLTGGENESEFITEGQITGVLGLVSCGIGFVWGLLCSLVMLVLPIIFYPIKLARRNEKKHTAVIVVFCVIIYLLLLVIGVAVLVTLVDVPLSEPQGKNAILIETGSLFVLAIAWGINLLCAKNNA